MQRVAVAPITSARRAVLWQSQRGIRARGSRGAGTAGVKNPGASAEETNTMRVDDAPHEGRPTARGIVSGFGVVRATDTAVDSPVDAFDVRRLSNEPHVQPPADRESLRADLARFRRERLGAAPSPRAEDVSARDAAPSASTGPSAAQPPEDDDALADVPRDAAGRPYPLTDLQKLQLARLRYKREVARRDARDVLRKHTDEYLRRMPALDPVARQQRQDRIVELARRVASGTNEDEDGSPAPVPAEDALLAALEGMPDDELREALRAGAIDPVALWEQGADEALPLPNEFLTTAAGPSTLVREIAAAALQPAEPTDDEAAVLDRFERGDKADFTDADIKTLARFEARAASAHTLQPNEVLRFVAGIDPKVAESLRVMDRAKRATMRDAAFQRALLHSKRVGDDEMQRAAEKAKPRKLVSAVDRAFFVDEPNSAPPKKFAMSAHDEPEERYDRSNMREVRERRDRKRAEQAPSRHLGGPF
eukprot:CAMPEP_0174847872 /NCGR_PEP_ID=MMETSP1114-20130205/13177_1 /TAXON_ID=312471 /ORGANISM="Neobodo designis, Strain CCAP 1951/1" /LENGTH=479 /DNA_ID=CAMNT_0016082159 /DNA_START=48 /DNA_END=1484 /DNA_ORIENTATION=+